jgi:hypothetical protein
MCLRQFEQDIETMHQEEQEEVRDRFLKQNSDQRAVFKGG